MNWIPSAIGWMKVSTYAAMVEGKCGGGGGGGRLVRLVGLFLVTIQFTWL